MSAGHGVTAWSSAGWRAEAVAWLDEQLVAAGIARSGEVEQPHLGEPWSTVLRAPTSAGLVWMKAGAPGTAFEPGLAGLLARFVPAHVLAPIAIDPARGWLLLPDGGPALGDLRSGRAQLDGLVAALVRYGRLQRELEPHVDELLGVGVADMRPAAMPERFREALAAVGPASPFHARVAALEPTVLGWCERLAASPLAPSLDHNDLHPGNVLGDGGERTRFFDWGDSVVAHPLAVALVPLTTVRRWLGTTTEDPRFRRARDAYLDVFAYVASREDLAETLVLAGRVARIARVLTWDRALRSAREQGEPIDTWAAAPEKTLARLLDVDYV